VTKPKNILDYCALFMFFAAGSNFGWAVAQPSKAWIGGDWVRPVLHRDVAVEGVRRS
jgi:hypothetical protein